MKEDVKTQSRVVDVKIVFSILRTDGGARPWEVAITF